MPAADQTSLIRRALRLEESSPERRCLGLVAERDGSSTRVFWGKGTQESAIAPPEGWELESTRPLAGGHLQIFKGAHGPEDERHILSGRNVLFGYRLNETPAQIAEWLSWHSRHHNAEAALLVNRADPSADDGFAEALNTTIASLPITLLLVEPDFALGHEGRASETHPISAPDAPGKERMPAPEPNAWTAPLGEGAVQELIKWRWLGNARAVALLDPCDLLPPRAAGEPDVFTRATEAAQGVILLFGQRIYPWRLRNTAAARFGDHICRPFEPKRGIGRWVAAPAKVGLQKVWRLSKIAYTRPDPSQISPFWRAMAIRVPGQTTSTLIAKTALVEDPALLHMAELTECRPVRPPVSSLKTETEGGERSIIVATMKNEGPFILEWLAWHRAIGVTDFLVYTNDCTDGTDTLLALLQRKGYIQHRANPWRAGDELNPQNTILQLAESEPVFKAAAWAITIDSDEFINIKIGDGRLPALYRAMEEASPGANMISLTWRLFGNADVHEFKPEFLLTQFTLCAPEQMRKPHQAWGFKTLFRNNHIYKKMGIHRPKGLRPDLWNQINWLNGSGQPMPSRMYRNGWRSTVETVGYDWAQINHYALRSAESFLVKRDRGRAHHVDQDKGLQYWFRMNHNVEEDRSILRLLPQLEAEFNKLIADPEIAAAHEATIAAHRAKIAELHSSPKFESFYQTLISPRLERLARNTPHFSNAVYLAGPDCIPDAIAAQERLPEGFVFTIAAPDQMSE